MDRRHLPALIATAALLVGGAGLAAATAPRPDVPREQAWPRSGPAAGPALTPQRVTPPPASVAPPDVDASAAARPETTTRAGADRADRAPTERPSRGATPTGSRPAQATPPRC